MPKAVLVVLSRPTDQSREDEYNDWYDNRHLGEVTDVPGFKSARRYKLADVQLDAPGSELGEDHPYLALYEIEVDDLETIPQEMRERASDGRMFMSEAIEVDPVPPAWIYEEI